MKLFLPILLVAVLAAGLWQGAELSRLASREAGLRAGRTDTPDSNSAAAVDRGGPTITKTARRVGRESFDPAAYVEKLVDLIARHQAGEEAPAEEETSFVLEELASASPRELKELVSALRQSPLPDDIVKSLFQPIAPRLAESDPEFAAGLAWEAGEWKAFQNVLRSWLSRDPARAAAWFDKNSSGDPAADAARFRSLGSLEFQALAIATRLASDPGIEGVDELLRLKSNPLALALGEIVAGLAPGELAAVMNRISRHAGSPEVERLHLIGSTLASHPDPATARQVLLDAALPPEQFRQAATTMIVGLDPVGIRAGVEWFRTSASGETKIEGLRGIVATWARQDPKAATEWAEGLADPAERANILGAIPEKQAR